MHNGLYFHGYRTASFGVYDCMVNTNYDTLNYALPTATSLMVQSYYRTSRLVRYA
jgi:hypothetical protein